jgi:hypothetical protein
MSLWDMWIIVPNWDRFQHYKDRNPAWIRTYVDLLDRPEYIDLTPTEQALLHRIWMMYARTNGQLRCATVAAAPRHRRATVARPRHFESLNHAGFIALSASRPAPQRQRQRHKRPLAVTSKDHVGENSNSNGRNFEIPKDLFRDVPR